MSKTMNTGAAAKAKQVKVRKARFNITFTVEVEIPVPARKGWQVSDAICDVEDAATELVDMAGLPFTHEGVTITDTVSFRASFDEEL